MVFFFSFDTVITKPDVPTESPADLPDVDAPAYDDTQDADEPSAEEEAHRTLPPPLDGEFALALSGGGYRAAAYHLGVLDVLCRLDRLDMISTLSTISGGTLLGACYALSRTRDEPFDTFYQRMYRTLRDVNVIEDAFKRLNKSDDNGKTAPSLVRAAAKVYASDAFAGDARMGDLFPQVKQPEEDRSGPLNDLGRRVVFSATEFASGIAFRFQTGDPGQNYYAGNGRYRVDQDILKHVRLADAMAASSCFPSVFEPIRFPDDFDWGSRSVADIRAQLPDAFADPVPLMDGGTFDNQGVNGILTTYRPASVREHFGWMMVSDSSPEKEPPIFKDPVEKDHLGLTIGILRIGGWITMMVALLSGGLLTVDIIVQVTNGGWVFSDLLTEVVPLLLVLLTVAALVWVRARYADLQSYASEQAGVDLLPVADLLSVDNLAFLVKERFESLVSLTSDIFMKRIRSLVMQGLYTNPTMTTPPTGGDPDQSYQRFAFNLIYSTDKTRVKLYEKHPQLKPSDSVKTVARRASSVPTTLWFSDDPDTDWNQLDTVIAAGQVTTCFVLLRFLLRWYPGLDPTSNHDAPPEDHPASALYHDTLALWTTVNAGSIDDALSLLPTLDS